MLKCRLSNGNYHRQFTHAFALDQICRRTVPAQRIALFQKYNEMVEL